MSKTWEHYHQAARHHERAAYHFKEAERDILKTDVPHRQPRWLHEMLGELIRQCVQLLFRLRSVSWHPPLGSGEPGSIRSLFVICLDLGERPAI
jgi:hypothetical protein